MGETADENRARIRQTDNMATAVSVFNQDGAEGDFPVLKAFQQYLDAEQARARKRMLNLAVFFIVLLVIVVVAFAVIMTTALNRDQARLSDIAARNQALSDKLLDIALRERPAAPQPIAVPAVQPPPSDAALKTVLDQLAGLQAQIAADRAQTAQTVARLQQQSREPAPVALPAPTPRQDEQLRRQQEVLRQEREKLRREREELRRAQVEQHRRRLYPEYYAQKDKEKEAASNAARPVVATRPSARPPEPAAPASVPAAVKEPPRAAASPAVVMPSVPPPKATPLDLAADRPISYFSRPAAERAPAAPTNALPVPRTPAPKASSAPKAAAPQVETIKVGADGDGNAIPFLIELPAGK